MTGKLKNTKEAIKQWRVKKNEEIRKKTQEITYKMNGIDLKAEEFRLSEDEIITRKNLHQQLLEMETTRLQDIRQKARCKWALEGDENSRFFHGLLNKNTRNQRLSRLNVKGT